LRRKTAEAETSNEGGNFGEKKTRIRWKAKLRGIAQRWMTGAEREVGREKSRKEKGF